ncbi:peptidase [Desulfonema ishimotonii]|uniref:Peptidase n=1 Tax=Desulfonema ishimotonii TaxID=45657 RepID=A0A401FV93_9BACT|nr:DegQ family serine endoprotease [Desulfonema ishimotonii]GBC60886.1 peptidase [Desulfonema ishimotonii]
MRIMKKGTGVIATLAMIGLLFAPGPGISPALAETGGLPGNVSKLAKKVRPGVVNIRTVKTVSGGSRVFRHFYGNPQNPDKRFRDFFAPFLDNAPSREFKQRSLGSGFIISREGYIVTNNHVIEDADQIKVRLANEKEFDAEVVGRDSKTDLALIRIAPSDDLVPLPLGDSDALEVGSWVIAIGSPFGLEQTVTAGIVSAKGRTIGSGPYDDFIQTDASINPGNSGGPLLSMKGEVIGINTAIIASGQGIGFAIPVNMAKGIIAQLKDKGEVTRGWLGVGIQDLTSEIRDYYNLKDRKGVLVSQVYEGEPADKGGIKPGDIITAVDDTPVTSARDLSTAIANLPVGARTKITLMRNGKKKTVHVTLDKRSDGERRASSGDGRSDDLGLSLSEPDAETARQFGYDDDEKGLLVTQVRSGGKADQAGIREGDLILEVNREPVSSVGDYRREMRKTDSGQSFYLLIKRGRFGLLVVKMSK